MKSSFAYTGIRVRDLDEAVRFFTRVMGMKLLGRVKPRWTQGEFANLLSADGKHWLELNWYPENGPIEGPYREGAALDHLGFEVEDLDAALANLMEAGYPVRHGPFRRGGWQYAFVPVVDGLWLDVFHRTPRRKKKASSARRRVPRRRRR